MQIDRAPDDPALLLLGPVVLRGPRGEIHAGARESRLLAALAVDRPLGVSKETLIERIWSEDGAPPTAAASMRTYVSRLRLKLASAGLPEGLITTTERGYRLDPTGIRVDADEFIDLVERAPSAELADGVALVDHALDLWRGSPYGTCSDEIWVKADANRLDELKLAARELRLTHLADTGAHDVVIAEARELAAGHPWRDGIRGALITALYGAGRSVEALAAYQDYRRELMTDLGLEPGPELQELERRILANDARLLRGRPQALPGYVLGEPIGSGAFSTVWRARQSSLDRDVAIKEIRPELADRPSFIRRFETEAQLVARLEHPNAVPVHDYWREPGAAYVVMRLLRGGSLVDRLERGPLPAVELMRLAEQVGGALQLAHELGIVHRDVKPGNILLDEAGNYLLTDFGIAALLDADDIAGPASRGSPRYAAPEQLRGDPATPAVDVFGLGATLRSAAAGKGSRPHRDRVELEAVLARATSSEPSERPPDVATLVGEVRGALGFSGPDGVGPGDPASVRNPFRGLRHFDEVDADVFRGRERAVADVLDRLTSHPVVAVVGASGSGKSSLVRAGVLPVLRQQGLGEDAPLVALMVPGDAPFERLATALRSVSATKPVDSMELRTGPSATLRRVLRKLVPPGGAIVLVIDQFEELFTATSASDRAKMLDELVDLVTGDDPRARLLITLRADHWGRPLDVPIFGDLLAEGAVHLGALGPSELQRVISDPIRSTGCRLEDGLLGRLIHDTAGRPGTLPLLQYTLTELFDRRLGELLTNEAYDELGGLAGSVAATAERVHADLDDEERVTARRLFGQLALLEGGVETRRRVGIERLSGPLVEGVLDRFVAARLLTRDYDPVTREPMIEVAHEALFDAWDRLRGWLADDQADRDFRVQLAAAAQRWSAGGLDEADLLRGTRLEACLDWVERTSPTLTSGEVEYLKAGQRLRDRERDRERRRLSRLRLMLVATAVLLALAVGAGVVADAQRDRANVAQGSAETRRLVADVSAATATSRELGLLLAVEAHKRDPSPATLGALQRALTRTGPFLGLLGAGTGYREVQWSLSGDTVYALHDEGVDALTVADGTRTEVLVARTSEGLALTADGRTLAVATVHRGVVLVDTTSGAELRTLQADGVVSAVDFDPTGRLVASGDRDGLLRLWNVASGDLLAPPRSAHSERQEDLPPEAAFPEGAIHEPLGLTVGVERVRFTPDGQQIVTTGGVFVRSFDAVTLEPGLSLALDRPEFVGDGRLPATPTDLDFIDDHTVAIAGGRHVKIVDLEQEEAIAEYQPGAEAGTIPDDFDLDVVGDQLITSVGSGLLGQLRARDGRRLAPIIDTETRGARTLGVDVAVDPEGVRAAVAGDDGVRILSLDGTGLIHRSVDRPGWATRVHVSADGRLLVWAAPNHPPTFHELNEVGSPAITTALDGAVFGSLDHYGAPSVLQVQPSGSLVVAHLLDPKTLQPTGDQIGPASFANADVSLDDRWLAVGRSDPEPAGVGIYDRTNLSLVAEVEPPDAEALTTTAVAWHPDGVRVAAVFAEPRREQGPVPSFVLVFDRETGEIVSPPLTNPTTVTEAVFSPDGRYLLTGDFSGKVIVRDAETFQPVGTELIVGTSGLGAEGGRALQFTADGQYLVSTLGPPVLVDVATWTAVGGPFPSKQGFQLGVPDGARYLPTVTDESAVVWTLDPERWSAIACQAAGRNLTPAEWRQYGPTDRELTPTCRQWS